MGRPAAGHESGDTDAAGRRSRRLLLGAGLLLAGAALAACGRQADFGPGSVDGPVGAGEVVTAGDPAADVPGGITRPVIPSADYAAAVGEAVQRDRITGMSVTVTALRGASTSGWQARQDDVSGYASELSGGRWIGTGSPTQVAQDFVESYGSVFGPPTAFSYTGGEYDGAGVATVRARQVVGTVPVDAGTLVIPVTRRDGGGEISLVRGRLYDVSAVATTPSITAAEAVRTVQRAVGSEPADDPALVVFTGGEQPRLTWGVVVLAAPPGDAGPGEGGLDIGDDASTVYVDAQTGEVLGSRPLGTSPALAGTGRPGSAQPVTALASADLGKDDFTLPPAGRPITVPLELPDGTTVEVNAERLPDGSIVMVDATGPRADRRTKKGIIAVFDGSSLDGRSMDLGPVVRFKNGRITNPDALMAMWSARQVVDYYRDELGRLSFDGQNSPVVAVVGFTAGQPCFDNASFLTAPGESRMMIGVPCRDRGEPTVNTFADLYIVGHEITHGVTHTNALDFARDNTQQGAIDEGTSDYFGVIVENAITGRVGTTGAYYACYGRDSRPFCAPQSDGQRGLRDINSGATFDDYAFTLADPYGFASAIGDDGHLNSLVWTNALWRARTRLAQLDGGDALTSPRARAFDRAVHRATTTYLTTDTDLVGAAEGVQRAMSEVAGLGPEEQMIVRDQFRTSKLCRGCTVPLDLPSFVAASAKVKTRPAVAGDRVVYTQFEAPLRSRTMVATPGQGGAKAAGTPNVLALRTGAHGDWVAETTVTIDARGNEQDTVVLTDLRRNKSTVLSRRADPTVAPAVSSAAVVWADFDGTVTYRPLTGGQQRSIQTSYPVAHLATDGRLVAVQEEDGTLSVWDTGSNRRQRIDQLDWARVQGVLVPGGGLAMSGSRIAALAQPLGAGEAVVYDLEANTRTVLSDNAAPFGIAIDGDLVVWPEITGLLPGRVNQISQGGFVDTELRGYSFTDETMYEMVDPRGQQGFPALGGGLLAWQDTAGGGNDIIALRLPGSG